MKNESFQKLFHGCVAESLRYFMGKNAPSLFFSFLQNRYGVTEEKIGEHIDWFAQGLTATLGKDAAHLIELDIVKRLYEKMNLQLKRETDFLTSVTEAKASYEKSIS
jgi:hypothetical protein